MNRSFLLAGAAILLQLAMFATANATTTGSTAPPGPIVVGPGTTGTNGDVVVDNNEGSRGKVRIKSTGGSNTEVKSDGSVQGEIRDIDAGDTVIIGTNSTVRGTGTGGSVSIGSGSTVTIANTSAAGGTNITATLPGGSIVTILPGATVPITG